MSRAIDPLVSSFFESLYRDERIAEHLVERVSPDGRRCYLLCLSSDRLEDAILGLVEQLREAWSREHVAETAGERLD